MTSMIEVLLGVALLLATYWMLRRAAPRPDGTRPAYLTRPGMDTAVALLFTFFLAFGGAMLIDGAFGVWADASALWAAVQ